MPEFLVETYEPGSCAAAPAAVDADIRHLRSIRVPEDEMCLHVFRAPSLDAVREALDRVAFAYERIVEAVTDHEKGER